MLLTSVVVLCPLRGPWEHHSCQGAACGARTSVTSGRLASVALTPRAAGEEPVYTAIETDPHSEGLSSKVLSNLPMGKKRLPVLLRAELGHKVIAVLGPILEGTLRCLEMRWNPHALAAR